MLVAPMTQDRVERAARSLMRSARRALIAQERNMRWSTKVTNSSRAQSIERAFEQAMADFERAESEMEEALQPYNR